MARLSVELEGPESRSLTFRIRSREASCLLFIFSIPSDTIAELVSALLVLAQSGAPSMVLLNEEPTQWELVFQPDQGRVTLTLRWIFQRRDGSIERRKEFSAQGSLDEIVRPFWKALRHLETRYQPEEYARRWGYLFPTHDMALLTTWVRARKP